MRARKQTVDNASVANATWRAGEGIKRTQKLSEQFTTDPERSERLEKQECMACFYCPSRIGGAAVTVGVCGLCDKEEVFGNTCVDVLCKDCANRHDLCIHCGGDIESKQRRKQRF